MSGNFGPDQQGSRMFHTVSSNQTLRSYHGRLATFGNWPKGGSIDPRKLAKAGFYSINYGDIVRCAYCSVEGYLWTRNDNPMRDHIQWNEEQGLNCSFIRGQLNQPGPSTSYPVHEPCDDYGITIFPNSFAERRIISQLDKLCITVMKEPAHPEYINLRERQLSFARWPKALQYKSEELINAGFFYAGIGDETICFQCGGGLKDWEEADMPWVEHALWFPNCPYVIQQKGLDYINKIKNGEKPTPVAKPDTKPDEKQMLCKICYKNELAVLFTPCGHISTCEPCSYRFRNCPICRRRVLASVRAYIQ